MKRILITGQGSFIGTSFEKWLAQARFDGMYWVDTVDMRGERWKEKDFSGYDTVFHVAGIAHADIEKITEERKRLYYRVNCELAVEAAKKSRRDGVRQFIYMSSIIVYGEGTDLRKKRVITKETAPAPSNFYGDSKWRAEQKLTSLSTENFSVAILRPPVIYGEGCRGNYQSLIKIALKTPVFPDFPNERSMCAIERFCEFVRMLIERQKGGVFFPQDKDYVKTAELVRQIAKAHQKRVILFKGLNWAIYLMGFVPGKCGRLVNRAFGSLVYERGEIWK